MSIRKEDYDPPPLTIAADFAQDIRLPISAEQFHMARSALIDAPLRAGVSAVGEMLKPRSRVVGEQPVFPKWHAA